MSELSPGSVLALIKNSTFLSLVILVMKASTPPCFCVNMGCVHDATSLLNEPVVLTP